jgi:hypothetical protein
MTLAEEKVQSVLSRRVGSSLSCSMPLLGVVLSRHYFYFLVIVLIRKHHSPAATKAGFHFLVIYTAWILLQTERHGLLKLITDKRVLPQTIFRTFSLSSPRSSLIWVINMPRANVKISHWKVFRKTLSIENMSNYKEIELVRVSILLIVCAPKETKLTQLEECRQHRWWLNMAWPIISRNTHRFLVTSMGLI